MCQPGRTTGCTFGDTRSWRNPPSPNEPRGTRPPWPQLVGWFSTPRQIHSAIGPWRDSSFALAYRRYVGASSEPDAWMAILFLLFSILGAMVFAAARSNAVAILIIGVALGYAREIPTRFGVFRGQLLVGSMAGVHGNLVDVSDLRHRIQYRPGQALVGLESHPHAGLDNLHERV